MSDKEDEPIADQVAEATQDDDGQEDDDVEDVEPVASSAVNPDPFALKMEGATTEDLKLMEEERKCLLLLLEARKLLTGMILKKEMDDKAAWAEKLKLLEEEKKRTGNLSVQEIQEMLQSHLDEEDVDLNSEIAELKKQLMIEIRRNHVLDRDLAKLDKRIALLIKNRDQAFVNTKKRRRAAPTQAGSELTKDPKKLENYQDLFYLLQTEPKYLARALYVVNEEAMEGFLDTTILTLYGDGSFSPREEYLILSLFRLAIEHEMSRVKQVSDFLAQDSVVPKMVITYNRRKQGLDFLKTALSPVIAEITQKGEANMELQPMLVYQAMINQMEIDTGEKSDLPRNVTEAEALQNSDVQKILADRRIVILELTEVAVKRIIETVQDVPYGLRWVCKQLKLLCEKALPDATTEELTKLVVYFVYYRFINPAIVTPDAYKLVDDDMPLQVRKNLVVVAKMLQMLFNFREYGEDQKHMMPFNTYIQENKERIMKYMEALCNVPEPEDQLKVNKYMELTQKSKPVILISINEIFQSHRLLNENLDSIAPEKDDPIRTILSDLGPPPPPGNEEDDRELQLTLTNRFKVDMEEEDETERLYAETKELVIPILRVVPLQSSIQRLNLMDVLESGIKYASDEGNTTLTNQINTILENIGKLEREGMLSKDDNYESFVHDVAMEVANRKAIREHQRKEITRLKLTLDNLRKHQAYINEQIEEYNSYLKAVRAAPAPSKGGKKKKKHKAEKRIAGPFKFSYKELQKSGVIIDSEVPTMSRGTTKFLISSEAPGVFDIVAKIAGVNVEKMQLELDDLLERHYNNIIKLELDQVTLDVNMTIALINKHFLRK